MSEDNNHDNHEDKNSDTEVQKLETRPKQIITMDHSLWLISKVNFINLV